MKEKYLPIGTVVTLKNATKRIMIIGYLPVVGENKEVYDYSACTYPEGLLSSDKTLAFNHNQIDSINFNGLEDEESIKFNETVKSMVSGIESLKGVNFSEGDKKTNLLG